MIITIRHDWPNLVALALVKFGITKMELAKQLGVSRPTLKTWADNHSIPLWALRSLGVIVRYGDSIITDQTSVLYSLANSHDLNLEDLADACQVGRDRMRRWEAEDKYPVWFLEQQDFELEWGLDE